MCHKAFPSNTTFFACKHPALWVPLIVFSGVKLWRVLKPLPFVVTEEMTPPPSAPPAEAVPQSVLPDNTGTRGEISPAIQSQS